MPKGLGIILSFAVCRGKKNWFRPRFSILARLTYIKGDWHSFHLRSPSRHIYVEPQLQNKKKDLFNESSSKVYKKRWPGIDHVQLLMLAIQAILMYLGKSTHWADHGKPAFWYVVSHFWIPWDKVGRLLDHVHYHWVESKFMIWASTKLNLP